MQRQSLAKSFTVISALAGILALAGSTSCGLFGGGGLGLSNVSDLVSGVERVHVAAELSKERVQAALDRLNQFMEGNFEGKPVEAYVKFKDAIDRSDSQGRDLRRSVDNMKSAADRVFSRWQLDLDKFKSEVMRTRSRSRLEATRERYKAIVAAADPAVAAYEAINGTLRDHALFLGNDFNANSVAEIADDVRELGETTNELQGHFNACLDAARIYLDAAAPSLKREAKGASSER